MPRENIFYFSNLQIHLINKNMPFGIKIESISSINKEVDDSFFHEDAVDFDEKKINSVPSNLILKSQASTDYPYALRCTRISQEKNHFVKSHKLSTIQIHIPQDKFTKKVTPTDKFDYKSNLNSKMYLKDRESALLKDIDDLKSKFLKMEQSIKFLKNKRNRSNNCDKCANEKLYKRNKTITNKGKKTDRDNAKVNLYYLNKIIKKQRQISLEIKKQLVLEINQLTLSQKKEMRYIIKDYITIYRDGEFEFNIDCLPNDTFIKLKRYVQKCLNETGKISLKTLETVSTTNSTIADSEDHNMNIKPMINQFSTTASDKRNPLFNDSFSSSLDSSSSFISDT